MIPLNDLPSETQDEIFQWLKPYTLNQVSLTCKQYHQRILVSALWEKHLISEFPYSFEKGSTSFERYSNSKRKSLRHIERSFDRKCALLVEEGHFIEFKDKVPQDWSVNRFLLSTFNNKTLLLMINEQNDQEMKDFFYREFEKENDTKCSVKGKIIFGKVDLLNGITIDDDLLSDATISGSIESFEYLMEQNPILPKHFIHRAVSSGSLKIIKWLYEHGALFDNNDYLNTVYYDRQEILSFFLENMLLSPKLIKKAINEAIYFSKPRILEILLPHFSQEKADLNNLLEGLNFNIYPYSAASCLKILLDKGADVNHPTMLFGNNVTLLFLACYYSKNEIAIELLLERGGNPNLISANSTPFTQALYLKKKSIIELFLKYDAEPTNHDFEIVEELLNEEPDNQELLEIINLLNEKLSQ